MLGYLAQKEFEEIAANLKFKNDDTEELLDDLSGINDIEADFGFDSSDDEPLINLVPDDKRNWSSSFRLPPLVCQLCQLRQKLTATMFA
ncbi:hypothetical protein QE152_g22355 [Popillia japonica]|uniref:Uncharacterized protein n=1 Tax=Popillia japonica TaxID=7064 RepID=A0AAW1KLV7_POPJA